MQEQLKLEFWLANDKMLENHNQTNNFSAVLDTKSIYLDRLPNVRDFFLIRKVYNYHIFMVCYIGNLEMPSKIIAIWSLNSNILSVL